jgi:Fe2+ or Zn2+ uptake regulation protein
MACVHLRRLYQLCQEEGLRISSSDLIHFVCDKCGVKDVCPSTIVDIQEADEDDSDESL